MMRQVIVYKSMRGDWVAECPSLPNCVCRAATKVEALDTIKQCIDEYINELKAHQAPIPEDALEVSVVWV